MTVVSDDRLCIVCLSSGAKALRYDFESKIEQLEDKKYQRRRVNVRRRRLVSGVSDSPVRERRISAELGVKCFACGSFVIDRNIANDETFDKWWTTPRRAALSHALRRRVGVPRFKNTNYPHLSEKSLDSIVQQGAVLPTPPEQANNIIRLIGGKWRETGQSVELGGGDWAYAGCESISNLIALAQDLRDEGLISHDMSTQSNHADMRALNVRLSMSGWRYLESLQTRSAFLNDGFIAMQFGDRRVDEFVQKVIQGRVSDQLGKKIQRCDSPGQTRAGVIDNIMREAIENASFVLVELSHGNRGAYWEAGLAEGLRKPVIYLCEQGVWENPETRPHFDVNHRTTVMWDENNPDDFVRRLVPTIKNSLRHHYPDT